MFKSKPLLILVAGPYRSGTNGDPQLVRENLDRLEFFAFLVYHAGHIPMIGEWVALPLIQQAGSKQPGDAIAERYLYPVAGRLLERCDAVLRIAGESKGADEDVRIARERGLPVYHAVNEIPAVRA
jgi:hypothetical protein